MLNPVVAVASSIPVANPLLLPTRLSIIPSKRQIFHLSSVRLSHF